MTTRAADELRQALAGLPPRPWRLERGPDRMTIVDANGAWVADGRRTDCLALINAIELAPQLLDDVRRINTARRSWREKAIERGSAIFRVRRLATDRASAYVDDPIQPAEILAALDPLPQETHT